MDFTSISAVQQLMFDKLKKKYIDNSCRLLITEFNYHAGDKRSLSSANKTSVDPAGLCSSSVGQDLSRAYQGCDCRFSVSFPIAFSISYTAESLCFPVQRVKKRGEIYFSI